MATVIWKCKDCGKTGIVDITMFGKASLQLEKIDSAHSKASPKCPGKELKVELSN
jgi:ribosomal protein L37AE/L43A